MEPINSTKKTTNIPVLVHVCSVTPSIFLGAAQLMLKKGTPIHVWNGRVWSSLMVTACISSFWLRDIRPGKFSFIHPLAILTLGSVAGGIIAARKGNIKVHKKFMIGGYVGMVTAGAFTFVPPRRMARFVATGTLPWENES